MPDPGLIALGVVGFVALCAAVCAFCVAALAERLTAAERRLGALETGAAQEAKSAARLRAGLRAALDAEPRFAARPGTAPPEPSGPRGPRP